MNQKSDVRELLYALEQSRKKLLQPFFASLGLPLGQGQPRILNSLLQREEVTQKELADACRMDVTTLSRTLDHMEKAGLLRRLRAPDCRRSFRIVLTENGRETAQKVRGAFTAVDEKICAGFEPEELALLYEGLLKIKKNLE